jgi:sugar phosphate isomerase/epimerase
MDGKLSRRGLLKAGLAIGAGVATGVGRRADAAGGGPGAAPARDFAGLPMGLQTYSLRGIGNFDKVVSALQGLGIRHAEFYSSPDHFKIDFKPEEVAARLEKLKAAGISPVAWGVEHFGKNHDANRAKFEFAKKLGLKNITGNPDQNNETFDSLDKLVEEYQIRVAIHNHGPKDRYNKPADVLKWIKDHHKLIGACADLGHYIRSGVEPIEAMEAFGDRLYGIHLKDFDKPADRAKGVILGRGVMKIGAVMKWLKEHKFDGALSLEYEENPKNPLPEIAQCLDAAAAGLKE